MEKCGDECFGSGILITMLNSSHLVDGPASLSSPTWAGPEPSWKSKTKTEDEGGRKEAARKNGRNWKEGYPREGLRRESPRAQQGEKEKELISTKVSFV